MDASQTRKQIQQMCRFIEQEAREKVNEIKLKVRSDENIDFRNRNRTLISTSRRLNLRFLIWRVEGRLIMNLRS